MPNGSPDSDPIQNQSHFPHSFSNQTSSLTLKSIPVFRPGRLAEIMSLRLRLERKQNHQMHFEFAYFSSVLSYSLVIETINTFIHSRSSFENHTRFQTKMGKFEAAHTYMAYVRKYSSGFNSYRRK